MNNNLLSMVEAQFIMNSNALCNLINAAQKKVTIKIDDNDLDELKNSHYSLCFAKKIGNFDYNVIWKSLKKYLYSNEFLWTPLYQIFATNEFQDSVKVKASTKMKNIGLGQITTLDKNGILSDPVTGGDTNSINVNNLYGSIHFAISQMSTDEDGRMQSTPIYVSKDASIDGSANFKPVEKVLVWFQSNAETSTMFAELKSNSFEIDMTDRDSINVQYEKGKWSIID